jgi:peroxiredoxin
MATTAPPGEIGSAAADFSLPATDGQRYALADVRGPNGVLVAFICNHCPYVRAIRSRLVRDARELQALGVGVVAINSNDAVAYPDDSFVNMRRIHAEWQLPFPYLYDESQQVARAYGAVCTPDFFGFDAQLKLRYRGRPRQFRQGRNRRRDARAVRRDENDRRRRPRAGDPESEHRLLDQVEGLT